MRVALRLAWDYIRPMRATIADPPGLKQIHLPPNLLPMSEQQKRTPTQITDATGRTVAANIRRLRERQGLSTYQLSGSLQRAGRPISPSAVAKVERCERRVDVGDLTAFAAALNVPPSALLLPPDDSPKSTVEITGGGTVAADVAWDWLDGRRPLRVSGQDIGAARLEFELYGRPPHRRGQIPRVESPTYIDDVNRYLREVGLEPELGEDGMVTFKLPRPENGGD